MDAITMLGIVYLLIETVKIVFILIIKLWSKIEKYV
jgi:hypothetical protein